MSKRAKDGTYARKYSMGFIALNWFGGLLSLLPLYALGRLLASSLASFRSCNSNNTGLYVNNCGKQGMNIGDLLLLILLGLVAWLSVALFANAWRLSRRAS